MNYAQIFAKNVQDILKIRGLNLCWLSEKSGLAISPIYSLQKPDCNPTIGTMEKIAETLTIPLALLLDAALLEENISSKETLLKNHKLFVGVLPEFEAFSMRKHDKKSALIQQTEQ